MTVQTSKGKAPHTYEELMRRIMIFEFQKWLLINLPQNKATSSIVISGKNKNKSSISYKSSMSRTFWGKVNDFTDEPVFKPDVPPIKNTFLDDYDDDDCKYILISILNVPLLELTLCIVLV